MFPKRHSHSQARKNQAGFLLPLALFIVVVMGGFAVVLSRTTIQTSTSAVQEMVTVQTFYAAESGAQRGMQTLFFPNPNVRNSVDSRCTTLNTTHTFAVTGLNGCSAVVTCVCLYQDNTACAPSTAANYSTSVLIQEKLTSFYTIRSTATCGTGRIRSTRTIEAGSFLRQE
ncbi:MAG: MSHA biogenesis protein MshP [Moraxellaceae bacterium]|nr:MAG: MSHA biogenesis protein MshP [Moraxellaceae bacterium]